MKTTRRFLLSIAVTLAVIFLSLMPVPEVPELNDVPFFDKWVHFVMYGGLCCVYWFDYLRGGGSTHSWKTWLLWLVIIPIVIGGLMEFCQGYLTTYRSGDWIDMLADTVGVLLALPVGLFIMPHLKWLVPSKKDSSTNSKAVS